MARKQITEEQLLDLVNAALRKHEECTDCRFTHVQRHEIDNEGCNWSLPSLHCSGTPGSVCIETANSVERELRSSYVLP